jgi:hypothetical protein
MFRYRDQWLYFEILQSDGIKTKEPITSENDIFDPDDNHG